MPIYTRCIQPQSIDPILFTNREDEYHHIKEILRSIIRARGEAERRLLIHGDRGTGKSILLRKVLSDLKQEIDFIPVIVDGKTSRNAEELLRDICENLASELRDEYEGDEKVIREISYLDEISRVSTVTKGWARSRAEEIEATEGAEIGIHGFFKLKMGIGGKETGTEELTRNVEIEIDSRFLRQLLSQVIETVSADRDKEVVIAIDGLDQIHDKAQIAEFVHEIFKYRKSLIIAVLRSEAITPEFHRSFRDTIVVKDLSGDALRAILDRRIENCPEKEILDQRLTPLADKLRTITANPFSFLTWVHFLCTNTELNPETMLDDLKGFVSNFYGFDPEKASVISKFFMNKGNPFLTREKIVDPKNISDEDYETMIENGILVPDNLYNERKKYRLSPDLAFFKLDM
ncbi:MAG: AAA family ATPase [Euryarchaeota archaeon]|nr:AAA family ATPase [Euryarchaeota archaeon]